MCLKNWKPRAAKPRRARRIDPGCAMPAFTRSQGATYVRFFCLALLAASLLFFGPGASSTLEEKPATTTPREEYANGHDHAPDGEPNGEHHHEHPDGHNHEHDDSPPDADVICYRDTAAFVVSPPMGWANDSEVMRALGLCAMFAPVGSTYNDAEAVLYPNMATAAGKNLEESVDLQAEWIRKTLADKPGGENIQVRRGEGFKTEQGLDVAIRLYDQGPSPNEWEAAAYLQHDGQLLMLVLSAREQKFRDVALPRLEEAARKVIRLDVEQDGEKKEGE